MNQKKWLRIVSIYSIIYTVITLLNSVLYLCNGVYEDPSGNWHELDRAMILLIGIAAFELYTNLPVKPMLLRYLTAYIPSLLLAFAYVWFSGLREPLAKTAYRDIWINFTGFFVLLCIINTAVYVFQKKEGRKEKVKGMIEAVNKFIPIFVGLLLILRGLLWIVDGKNGNKRSYYFGIAAIVVGIIMFVTVFFQVL